MKNMKGYITEDLLKHLQYYFDLIYKSKLDLEIDGVLAFNDKSQFVEGKVVNACSYLYESIYEKDSSKEIIGKKLKEIIDVMSERVFETWGILNCITALNRLAKIDQLNIVVSEGALNNFKEKLDWRTFVREDDLTLINKPTNYYGVAFGIARYRELLGFEPFGWSDKLLKKLLKHVDDFSGDYSFMDETPGQGRFDRYSILIPGEIAALLYETECDIPEKILIMLRKSCNIFLQLANSDGHGFSYGRSIGAYGDTAAVETLSIAAKLNILTPVEKDIAYGYSTFITEKFIDFWIDKETKSLNMWDKGRRTDSYRNKNRILGENLSLSMQLINSYEFWKSIGYDNVSVAPDYKDLLEDLPKFTKYIFADNRYSRTLYIIRDGKHVITLPLINGGNKYYKETPYLPIPNEFNLFTSAANSVHPNLIPMLSLIDGRKIIPGVYIKNITDQSDLNKNIHRVKYHLDSFVLIGGNEPEQFDGITSDVVYTFKSGKIECQYEILLNDIDITEIKQLDMEFATFSTLGLLKNSTVEFENGSVQSITAEGLNNPVIEELEVNGEYSTPVGPLKSLVKWRETSFNKEGRSLIIKWIICYS